MVRSWLAKPVAGLHLWGSIPLSSANIKPLDAYSGAMGVQAQIAGWEIQQAYARTTWHVVKLPLKPQGKDG